MIKPSLYHCLVNDKEIETTYIFSWINSDKNKNIESDIRNESNNIFSMPKGIERHLAYFKLEDMLMEKYPDLFVDCVARKFIV